MPAREGSDRARTIDYDSVAAAYDCLRAGDPEMVEHILRRVELRSESLVLDVGCGTTNNTLLLASATRSLVVGLDLSLGMLRTAILKTRSVPVLQATAELMPFTSHSFDLVYMTEVLHHLSDYASALTEAHRILKNRASLCIVTQSHDQIAERMTSRFFPSTVRIDQSRYPRISEIEGVLSTIGFTQVRTTEQHFSTAILGQEYLRTVEQKGYSMLHKVSEDEYSSGLHELKAALDEGEALQYAAGYTFVVAKREV